MIRRTGLSSIIKDPVLFLCDRLYALTSSGVAQLTYGQSKVSLLGVITTPWRHDMHGSKALRELGNSNLGSIPISKPLTTSHDPHLFPLRHGLGHIVQGRNKQRMWQSIAMKQPALANGQAQGARRASGAQCPTTDLIPVFASGGGRYFKDKYSVPRIRSIDWDQIRGAISIDNK